MAAFGAARRFGALRRVERGQPARPRAWRRSPSGRGPTGADVLPALRRQARGPVPAARARCGSRWRPLPVGRAAPDAVAAALPRRSAAREAAGWPRAPQERRGYSPAAAVPSHRPEPGAPARSDRILRERELIKLAALASRAGRQRAASTRRVTAQPREPDSPRRDRRLQDRVRTLDQRGPARHRPAAADPRIDGASSGRDRWPARGSGHTGYGRSDPVVLLAVQTLLVLPPLLDHGQVEPMSMPWSAEPASSS